MPLEQQIACILQSKHQQILKMPRHEQESRIGLSKHQTVPTYSPGGTQHIPVIRLAFTDCL